MPTKAEEMFPVTWDMNAACQWCLHSDHDKQEKLCDWCDCPSRSLVDTAKLDGELDEWFKAKGITEQPLRARTSHHD